MDEFSGITVLITGIERLAAILDTFSPTLDCISPLGLEDVADHYATMIEVMEAPENLKDIGDFAVLILETGQDIVLPLSAFEPVKITIDELEESRNFELKPTEHLNPATMLAHNLAAELIQAAFRHYRARKQGKQLRRKISSDHIVQQLAAQTIVQNLKRVLSKTKNKTSQNSLPPSIDEQLLNTNSLASSSTPLSSIHPSPDEGHKQQVSSPTKHNIPSILHNPRLSNILEICDVSVHSVPSVVWNDKNSLYIVLRINGFNFRSTTQYGAGEEAIWEGVLCSASMQNMLSKHGKDSKIVFELYNEHLAIKDKLIGQCEFSSASILDQTIACPIVEMTGEIMESAATTAMSANRKFRGTIACSFRLNDGEPSESNWWPAGRNDKNTESIPATARSKIVDVNAESIPEINGMSPRTIRAAADVLNAWESTPKAIHDAIPTKTKSQENNIPRPRSGHPKTVHHKKSSKLSTRLMDGISHARDPLDSLDLQPSEAATSVSGPNTARLSNITDDNHHDFIPMTATTSISGDNKSNNAEYHYSKPQSSASRTKRLFHDVFKARHVPSANASPPSSSSTAPVIVNVQFFFDKCFTMAFQTICSNLEMSALEIVILLDSLGHPVAGHWLEEASVISSSASASQTMMPFPSLVVPISHPAAFADCICQYVQNYPDILDQSQYFRFTEDHASLAITHLIRLLKGSYEDIRSEVFKASHCGSKDMTKRSTSSKVSLSTAATIRPSRYDQATCHQLLHLLQMPISVQDSVNHGQILLTMDTGKANNSPTGANSNALPSFSSYGHQRMSSMDSIASGTLLPQTLGTVVSVGSMIKSSLKRARLTLYQTTLRLLDSMWDKGARPWDKYPPTSTDKDSAKIAPSIKNTSIPHGTSGNSAMKRRKSLSSKSSQKSNSTNSGSSFVIIEAGKLFEALVPINRAYGFGYSMQELSHLANTVGGFLCMKDLPLEANDSTKSSENSSLLWVKVLFPSKEIKHHALLVLRQHVISSHRINSQQTENDAIHGFVYLRQRNQSKPLLSSQVSLGHSHMGHDSHLLSLTDEAVGAIEQDDNVDLLVHIPRTCLDSTSIGVSKLLQMSRSKLDSQDVHLGMRLRVVELATLQRLCERYEWYDRPSPETLQKLATHRVEVISVAELHSKGRVGVKLLRDDRLCDALPLEALQSIPKSTPLKAEDETIYAPVEDSNPIEEETAEKKVSTSRRKSKLKRRSSRDHREVAKDTPALATSTSHSTVPPPAVTTASLIADLAAMQKQQEEQREEIQKLKQKQEKLSKSTETFHKSSNDVVNGHEKLQPGGGNELDDNLDGVNHEVKPRPLPQMKVHVKHSKEEPKRPHTAVPNVAKTQITNQRPLSASTTRSFKTSSSSFVRGKPHNEEKDFSWLKPAEKLVEERMSHSQPTWAWPVVPTVGDESLPPTIQEETLPADQLPLEAVEKNTTHPKTSTKHQKPNKPNPPTLHHWQPSFPKETAEYTPGVYVYHDQPAHHQHPSSHQQNKDDADHDHTHQNHFTTFEIPLPSSPSRPPGDKSGITDINLASPTAAAATPSAFSPFRRPASAPAVERVAKKLKERQRQELEEQHKYTKFHESPPTSPPKSGGLGLSGFGYTNDGRKESAAFAFSIDDKLYETSEIVEKQEKIKKTKHKKPMTSRDASKAALKQLFGMNERHLEEEEVPEGHVNLNTHHLEEEKTTKMKPSNKRPSSASATVGHAKSKTATRGADQQSPPSSPEGKYRDIEMAKTAKEAAHKENYLLKQLKKLGV